MKKLDKDKLRTQTIDQLKKLNRELKKVHAAPDFNLGAAAVIKLRISIVKECLQELIVAGN